MKSLLNAILWKLIDIDFALKMIFGYLAKLYATRGKQQMINYLMRIAKGPLKETATDKEVSAVIEKGEKWFKTKEFDEFEKSVSELFKK